MRHRPQSAQTIQRPPLRLCDRYAGQRGFSSICSARRLRTLANPLWQNPPTVRASPFSSRLSSSSPPAPAYFYLRTARAAKLTDRDTVVLADFANTTGDSVFDGTLRQGLSSQLEQSPFLNLLSDQKIAQTLALMAQPKDVRLTRELARQICQRTGSAATIEGSISNLGSQYVVGLEAVNCHTGDRLAQQQVTATSKEQVLKSLSDASSKIREKLGESLSTLQKYDAPSENVTTASLEALQAYSVAYKAMIVNARLRSRHPALHSCHATRPKFRHGLGTPRHQLRQCW